MVQFVGIPFSLIFGRLPSRAERRRPLFLAFILFNLICLPAVGIVSARALPGGITGAPLPAYETVEDAVGEGVYPAGDAALKYTGTWETLTVSAEQLRTDDDMILAVTGEADARYELDFNGQKIEITYSAGPDRGVWAVLMDGQPLPGADTGNPLTIDGYNATVRYGLQRTILADEPGRHTLSLVNTGQKNPKSQGTLMTVSHVEVLPPIRRSNLLAIVGLILAVEAVGAVFALLLGRPLFSGLAQRLDTRRSIILALVVYAAIAIWGFFLNSVIEFWFLAWMVSIVQGGSQALSRSLYASMSPAAKSGEFFGLYGVMEKFSAIIGPLLFAAAAAAFDSSRPAVLSLIVLFFAGIFLLTRVNVKAGQRVAQQEDAALLGVGGATLSDTS